MQNPDAEIRIDATDAKAASNEGVVRWVLLISLALAVGAMAIVWLSGALSQDEIESAGTATQREEAVREANSSEPETAQEAGLVAEGVDERSQADAPVGAMDQSSNPGN